MTATQSVPSYMNSNVTCYRLGALEMLGRFARQLLNWERRRMIHYPSGVGSTHWEGLPKSEECMPRPEQHYHRALQIFTELGIDSEIGRALNVWISCLPSWGITRRHTLTSRATRD